MKRAGSQSEAKAKTGRVDLGLSSILSSFEPSAAEPPVEPAALPLKAGAGSSEPNFILVTSENPSVLAVPEAPKAPQDPFLALAQELKWEEVKLLAEKQLSTSGEKQTVPEIEARLWWIKSQLASGSVPTSILSAPLDSASARILEIQRTSSGSKVPEALTGFCGVLLQQLGELLFTNGERGLALSFFERAYRLDPTTGANLARHLKDEILKLRENPAAKHDLKLKAKLLKLEQGLKELEASNVDVDAATVPESRTAAQVGAETFHAPRSRPVPWGALALMSALLIVSAWGWRSGLLHAYLSSQDPAVATSALIVRVDPLLVMPEMQRVSGVSNLDALYYDIDAGKPRADGKPQKEDRAVAPPVGAAVPAVERVSESVGSSQGKVTVNTSGPVEGPEFRDLKDEKEDLSLRRSQELFGGGTGRRDDAPQGFEVEKFDADKLYVVIAKTNVMARPSYQTAALAELQTGDKVLVESKLGPWLKLRSKHGQSGYILAQDAELSPKR